MTTGPGALRLAQPRMTSHLKAAKRLAAYDPDLSSDGLTIDTPNGPVDLVAVERIQEGRPTPVTLADVRYAISLLPDGLAHRLEPLAAGLGITVDGVGRAFERHKRTLRTESPAP